MKPDHGREGTDARNQRREDLIRAAGLIEELHDFEKDRAVAEQFAALAERLRQYAE